MIDWERVDCLRDEIGEEDFEEVVRLFIEEVEEVVERLERSGTAGEREADLHFLKGSALNLGFSDLAALCQTEERRAAGGTTVETEPVIRLYFASRRAFLKGLGRLPGEAA
jgi:hypothetical protein